MAQQDDAGRFGQWGEAALQQIEDTYKIAGSDLYREEPGKGGPIFTWTSGILLSAFVAGAERNPKRWQKPLDEFARSLEKYWNPLPPVAGYDVLPVPKPADRYYDDNAWVVIALADGAKITGQKDYTRLAERANTFVFSGEDTVLGGGIYWRESDKASKNTCSNGPSAFGALRLYDRTKNPRYLADARRIYEWTRANLQDSDGLFWDNVNRDGKIERTKWSYNTALMLRTACALHRITGDAPFRTQAAQMAEAGARYWGRVTTGGVADGSQFAHLWTESLLDYGSVSGEARWSKAVARALTFLHTQVRDKSGFYGSHWDRPVRTVLAKPTLRDQASAARALLVCAAALSPGKTALV